MPGILPMKMIRVGSSTQSRIAQACDRCRSKKIRCDGVRPTCSQCSNVGFECKTSDKLSRRAFPRGYTESLEDRVRGLEAEIRELKQLLDERDEKIDMLSRIHSFSPVRKNSMAPSPTKSSQVKDEVRSAQEEVLHVEIPAPVDSTSTLHGASTTSALIEAFDSRVQEGGRRCSGVSAASLLTPASNSGSKPSTPPSNMSPVPPRLLSDQYINLFFQEWQPMLPILHRQTFLRLYEQFLSNPDAQALQGNKSAIAQLFLIFEIAAHSSSSKARPSTASYEQQWRKALSSSSSAPSLATLQCHVLAQLCYLLKADYHHLLRHRAYAVTICHQLGLHQVQKFHSLSPLEAESRKKAFWCQYVLDKFASASTGMPMMLRDCDITAEYPADVDDENISEQGISPALPLELTKISSALALFRMSRILAKTLEQLYPAATSYAISLKTLHSLSDELDQWHEELPEHLRLRFCNDKPATHLISDRSPILSLGYFYTRSLIHRPLLLHGSGSATASATIVLAAAAKHIIQIVDLLDERCMNYTFPVNKQDILVKAGFSVLWQCMDLEEDSKIIKDNQKSLTLLLAKIAKENTPVGADFQRVASMFVTLGTPRTMQPRNSPMGTPVTKALNKMPAPITHKQKTPRRHLQAIASRISNLASKDKPDIQPKARREVPQQNAGAVNQNPFPRNISSLSLISTHSAPAMQPPNLSPRPQPTSRPMGAASSSVNLDYFPFEGCLLQQPLTYPTQNSSTTMLPPRKQSSSTTHEFDHDHDTETWEHVASDFDQSLSDLYSTIEPNTLNKCVSNPEIHPDWNVDPWQLGDLYMEKPHVPQSLISFSEESMTSGDDFVFSTGASSHHGSMSTASPDALTHCDEIYKGITIPIGTTEDELGFSPDTRI